MAVGCLAQGLDFQLVHVDLSKKPSWFRAFGGLVPVVEQDGVAHVESLHICQ